MVGDAGGVARAAADEAEAVGQQRQAVHVVVLEGAQDGAVVDVEERDGLERAGERCAVADPCGATPDSLYLVIDCGP